MHYSSAISFSSHHCKPILFRLMFRINFKQPHMAENCWCMFYTDEYECGIHLWVIMTYKSQGSLVMEATSIIHIRVNCPQKSTLKGVSHWAANACEPANFGFANFSDKYWRKSVFASVISDFVRRLATISNICANVCEAFVKDSWRLLATVHKCLATVFAKISNCLPILCHCMWTFGTFCQLLILYQANLLTQFYKLGESRRTLATNGLNGSIS